MWTFSVGTVAGVTPQQVSDAMAVVEEAASYWGRYLNFGGATLDINVNFISLGPSTLAQAGTSFTSFGGSPFQADTILELQTGFDWNGSDSDIEIDINADTINSTEFYFGLLDDGGPLPLQFDLFSVILHEIGHGLGFLSLLDEPETAEFDTFVTGYPSSPKFTGPNAVDAYGGEVPLHSGPSHTAQNLSNSIMTPVASPGVRQFLGEVDVRILQDVGLPILGPTSGDDILFGFMTPDQISLGGGDDHFTALLGNDSILGEGGNDTLMGDGGLDSIRGGTGDDLIFGGVGNDLLTGDGGADEVFGGGGNDNVRGNAGDDLLNGGDGRDTIFGSSGSDTLLGEAGDDSLDGGNQSDTIIGGAGNDFLFGGIGLPASSTTDFLDGGDGDDTLKGGKGFDKYAGGKGIDEFLIESLDVLAFDESLNLFSTALDFEPGDIIDLSQIELSGELASLTFIGAAAFSGAGQEVRLLQHQGFAYLVIDTDGIASASPFEDAALKIGSGPFDLQQLGSSGVDALRFELVSGSTATAGNDTLIGSNGDESIDGLDGDDTIYGLAGDDTLIGGDGDDVLQDLGGSIQFNGGADTLIGGAGNDTLTGGNGADKFIVQFGDGADTITDFAATGIEQDVIEIIGHDAVFAAPSDILSAAVQNGPDVIITLSGGDTITLENTLLGNLDLANFRLIRDFDAETTSDGQTLSFSGIDPDGYFPINTGLNVTLNADGVIEVGSATSLPQSLALATTNSNFVNDGLIDGRVIGSALDVYSGIVDGVGLASNASFTNNGAINLSSQFLTRMAGINADAGGGTITNAGVIDIFNGAYNNGIAFGIRSHNALTITNSGLITIDAVMQSIGISASNSNVINTGDILIHTRFAQATTGATGVSAVTDFDNLGSIVVVTENGPARGVETGSAGVLNNSGEINVTGDIAQGVSMGSQGTVLNSGQITATATADGTPSVGLFFYAGLPSIFVVENSGVISADIAIDTQVMGSQLITNSGTINGIINLGFDNDQIDNAGGVINGDIELGEGDDLLDNRLGIINGTASGAGGDDTLLGGAGDENFSGGDGNDLLIGGIGGDTLNGGAGFDTASYVDAASSVFVQLSLGRGILGEANLDVLTGIEAVIGSVFDDSLAGTDIGNLLDGGLGDDVLAGKRGNDTLSGGSGDDLLDGGKGKDELKGGAGFDKVTYIGATGGVHVELWSGLGVIGEAAGDVLTSIEGVIGSRHNDKLTGSGASNFLDGDRGNDRLWAGGGDDTLAGGDGADFLNGQAGNDLLDGGADNDTLRGGAGADTMDGRSGVDFASYSNAASGVEVDLGNRIGISGDAAGDVLLGIEAVAGSAFDDTLHGGVGVDMLYGNDGADTLDGGMGKDVLDGGDGDDVISGGIGADSLNGGDGDDTLEGGAGADTLDGGAGFDTVSYANAGAGVILYFSLGQGIDDEAQGDVFTNIEAAIGSADNDLFQGSDALERFDGGAGDDLIFGAGGGDTISGDAGDDRLIGNRGNDTLHGGDDNDHLNGGKGLDVIDGGDGFDTASYIDASGGVQVEIWSGLGRIGEAKGDMLSGIEALEGSAYNDKLTGDGSANKLDGGYAGNDRLWAGGGNDTLNGGADNDLLKGQGGDDIMNGGTGLDTLDGAAGDDIFQFDLGGGADLFLGFAAGAATDDQIELTDFGAAFDTFAEVIAAATQIGADTVIDFGGGDVITLENVTLTALHTDDFLFG